MKFHFRLPRVAVAVAIAMTASYSDEAQSRTLAPSTPVAFQTAMISGATNAVANSVSSSFVPNSPSPTELPPLVETDSANEPPSDPFPARTYGLLGGESCLALLREREVPHARERRTAGVDTPVRLTGPVRGVEFHSEGSPSTRGTSGDEVLDCRLALALDDLARVLAKYDVREAIHYGMYRSDAVTPGVRRLRHHAAALAIDMGAFVKNDGTRLVVRQDWHGRIGAKTCGESATPWKPSSATLELRDILCTAVSARTFHLVLTPNHDARHYDHFHLEVMRHTSWTMVE